MNPISAEKQLADRTAVLTRAIGRIKTILARIGQFPDVQQSDTLQAHFHELDESVRAFQEELNDLYALAEVSRKVNSSLDLDAVLREVMDTAIRLLEAERGFLMLREPDGEMAIRTARDWGQESVDPSEAAVSRTIIQRVIEDGQPILTTNAREDPRFDGQESVLIHNLRSILCVPLIARSELIGVVYTDNRYRSGIFQDSDKDLLVLFANQAAIAIENARLFTAVRNTLAEVTELKNLMNNVLASITSGVITADLGNRITLCNRAAEAILGSLPGGLVGKQMEEALPMLAEGLTPFLRTVSQTEEAVVGIELNPTLPDSSPVDWRVNLSPLKDADQTTQGLAIVLEDVTERKKLEAQRRLLERMLSPTVIDQIGPNNLMVGGRQVELTILFADIRGFTSYSESQSPGELVGVLNRYLAAGAEAVLAEEGTVDKFLGDAVMAWFNAPLPQPDHTLRAVRAALSLRRKVQRLYKELPPAAHLAFGVGIHCGEAVLGWIGSESRQDFTAIGDSVNTTKRIQEQSGRNQILISAEALRRIKTQVKVRPIAAVTAKGKQDPLEVYELLGLMN